MLERARDGAGGRLAAGGAGAAVWLRGGGVGAPVRSQSPLGSPAAGTGRTTSRKRATTGARGRHPGASGHEVLGAGGAAPAARLPASGPSLRHPSVHDPRSRTVLRRLAHGHARGAATPARRPAVVSQNPAAAGNHPADGRGPRTVTRSADDRRDYPSRQPAIGGRGSGTGLPGVSASPGADRTRPRRTQPSCQ